jgi:hypothetical protein
MLKTNKVYSRSVVLIGGNNLSYPLQRCVPLSIFYDEDDQQWPDKKKDSARKEESNAYGALLDCQAYNAEAHNSADCGSAYY